MDSRSPDAASVSLASLLADLENDDQDGAENGDLIALVKLAQIVRRRRARFAQASGWPAMHPKTAEEEQMDALLGRFDA